MSQTSPPSYRYYFPLRVRYADTDAQGHVFFGNYFTYLDEAAGGYLREIGFSWRRMREMGLDIYYVNAQCNYSGSATFEDVLHVYVRMARIGNTSFTIEGVICKEGEDRPIASGQITSVMVNPQTRRPVPVPDALRRAVAAFEGETDR